MARLIDLMLQTPNPEICYFIVGRQKERIGVVKQLVAETSPVFQAMLFGSDIKEKGDVHIPDIESDALKLFLKFAYRGAVEVTNMKADFSGWPPQTCLDVIYLADKYDVPLLMEIALEQIKFTTVDDLFPALCCVATFDAASIALADQVQKIVQTETKEVIEHPNFLDISEASLLYILKQDPLNLSEVELWQAALAWARRQVGEDCSTEVRELLREPLQHLRLLTISVQDIFDHIEPSGLFTAHELIDLGKSITNKSSEALYCSNSINKRRGISIDLHSQCTGSYNRSRYKLVNLTKKRMKIKSLLCFGASPTSPTSTSVTLRVSTNHVPVLSYSGQVTLDHTEDLEISPDVLGWGAIELSPQCEYMIELKFGYRHPVWSSPGSCSGHTFSNGSITCLKSSSNEAISHIKQIKFEE